MSERKETEKNTKRIKSLGVEETFLSSTCAHTHTHAHSLMLTYIRSRIHTLAHTQTTVMTAKLSKLIAQVLTCLSCPSTMPGSGETTVFACVQPGSRWSSLPSGRSVVGKV